MREQDLHATLLQGHDLRPQLLAGLARFRGEAASTSRTFYCVLSRSRYAAEPAAIDAAFKPPTEPYCKADPGLTILSGSYRLSSVFILSATSEFRRAASSARRPAAIWSTGDIISIPGK